MDMALQLHAKDHHHKHHGSMTKVVLLGLVILIILFIAVCAIVAKPSSKYEEVESDGHSEHVVVEVEEVVEERS